MLNDHCHRVSTHLQSINIIITIMIIISIIIIKQPFYLAMEEKGGNTKDFWIQRESCAKTVSLNEHHRLYCYFNIFSYPIPDLIRPLGLQEIGAPRISTQGCQSYTQAVFTTSPGDTAGTHFCQRLNRPQRHSAAGKIKAMKNPNDPIENRTRILPACSAVPQSTATPRTPHLILWQLNRRRGGGGARGTKIAWKWETYKNAAGIPRNISF